MTGPLLPCTLVEVTLMESGVESGVGNGVEGEVNSEVGS